MPNVSRRSTPELCRIAFKMAGTKADLKRKAPVAETEADAASDDEFGLLEGVLEDDSEDDSSEGDEDADLDEEDYDNDFALESDDVPSDHEEYRVETDANGEKKRFVYSEVVPEYDSDDTDAEEPVNTIGNIPLSFYDSYNHIGYDIDGKKVARPLSGDALDALLETIDIPKGFTGLTDPQTGKPLQLSQDELELLRRVQMNEHAEGYDPYPDTVEWFTSFEEQMPLSSAPEPKRRFLPSKHEAKRIMKIVKAIKEGRILPYKPPEEREREEDEDEPIFDIWAEEKVLPPNVMHIVAPKIAPPLHDLSYNPPLEYLPSKDEKKTWEQADPEEREKEYLPQKYDSLRRVPGYDQFVKERFERCLDLYLAPRVKKNRLNIDPTKAAIKSARQVCSNRELLTSSAVDSLLPKLPRPEELKPFPTATAVEYTGHQGRVRSVAIDPSGVYVASGGDDGTVRIYELETGHQLDSIKLSSDEPVDAVKWRPGREALVLSAAVSEDIYLIIPQHANPELHQNSRSVLDNGFGHATTRTQLTTATGSRKDPPGKWTKPGARLEDLGVHLKVTVRSPVKVINWHKKGDHFTTVSPSGQHKHSSVAIHTLSRHLTQIPFRKLPGLAQTAAFHPTGPLFFVATQRTIRCYDLQRQELVKTLTPGSKWISCFDVHSGGDNYSGGQSEYSHIDVPSSLDVLHGASSGFPFRLSIEASDAKAVPSSIRRDSPLSSKKMRADFLSFCNQFHRNLPLFADASDDGTLQIFHGKVVNDMLSDPVLVPLKSLKGHKVTNKLGVMSIEWHPTHPWIVSAGADGTCRLWT
ncbi:eukaryotic ribosome biogenesis protein 1 [Seiridium cupressi]